MRVIASGVGGGGDGVGAGSVVAAAKTPGVGGGGGGLIGDLGRGFWLRRVGPGGR